MYTAEIWDICQLKCMNFGHGACSIAMLNGVYQSDVDVIYSSTTYLLVRSRTVEIPLGTQMDIYIYINWLYIHFYAPMNINLCIMYKNMYIYIYMWTINGGIGANFCAWIQKTGTTTTVLTKPSIPKMGFLPGFPWGEITPYGYELPYVLGYNPSYPFIHKVLI